ncbi:MAG: hypothetical protein ABW019_02530 [Chitinophagaceae bacterium]
MRAFKLIDAGISLALLIILGIEWMKDNTMHQVVNSYFIIGGWQVISMVVHAWEKWFTRKYSIRHIYHWIAFISLVTLPIGSYWILFVAAAPMAVFYTGLCFVECAVKVRRPLSLIKN